MRVENKELETFHPPNFPSLRHARSFPSQGPFGSPEVYVLGASIMFPVARGLSHDKRPTTWSQGPTWKSVPRSPQVSSDLATNGVVTFLLHSDVERERKEGGRERERFFFRPSRSLLYFDRLYEYSPPAEAY